MSAKGRRVSCDGCGRVAGTYWPASLLASFRRRLAGNGWTSSRRQDGKVQDRCSECQ